MCSVCNEFGGIGCPCCSREEETDDPILCAWCSREFPEKELEWYRSGPYRGNICPECLNGNEEEEKEKMQAYLMKNEVAQPMEVFQ
jgi:hypothetical protein